MMNTPAPPAIGAWFCPNAAGISDGVPLRFSSTSAITASSAAFAQSAVATGFRPLDLPCRSVGDVMLEFQVDAEPMLGQPKAAIIRKPQPRLQEWDELITGYLRHA